MAKKSKKNGKPKEEASVGFFQKLGKQLDDLPRVQAAGKTVERMKQASEKATQQTKDLGDLMDGTLQYVQKHPLQGVIVAMLAGIFLGRLFRR